MKKRILKNTSYLAIGDVFSFQGRREDPIIVVAIGPDAIGYTPVGCDADSDYAGIGTHETVWVDAPPRTTIGGFAVGERFRRGDSEYIVTAVGRTHSLAEHKEVGVEFAFDHITECEEVPE